MNVLELKGLAKRFGSVRALDGIDLAVPAGTFCVFLGPSGCGKSTALRCIAGLENPERGDIVIRGKRVNDLGPKERGIAMVFQSYALYPHMTVRQNLSFPLRMRKVPAARIDERVRTTARMLRIEHLLDRRPRELSGGERQRVAIGRAIVREPTLFLFDEPLSNLDAKLRNRMRLEIAALHRRLGVTVIYVTHDQVEAMTLGQMIVVINKGQIEQIGTPDDVYNRPATRFVAGFVGTPMMNFVSGILENGVFVGGGMRFPVATADRGPVELGIRPEDIRPHDGPVRGLVEMVENLGADHYAHLRIGDEETRWAVRLPRDRPVTVGDNLDISLPCDRLHLFVDGRRRVMN